MSNILDKLSEAGIEMSIGTLNGLNKIAEMDPVDFADTLKSIEKVAGQVFDNDSILALKEHAIEFQETIVKDGEFVENLADGVKAIDVLDKINNIADLGGDAIEMVSSTGAIISTIRNDSMTEQEKVDLIENQFLELKEDGAELVSTMVDTMFGSTISKVVDDKLREFIVSESGLERVSNKIGDFFDNQIDTVATKTGLKEWIIERSGSASSDSDNTTMAAEEEEAGFDSALESEAGTTEYTPAEGEVLNIASELEANMNLLYTNLEKLSGSINAI